MSDKLDLLRSLRRRAGASGERVLAYVARHGQTIMNVEGVIKGMSDVALDEKGQRQAAQLAARLQRIPNIREVYTSPMERAWETAAAYMHLVGRSTDNQTLIQDRRLLTLKAGCFEGTVKNAAREGIKLFLQNPTVPFPNGESIRQLEDRVWEFFEHELKEAKAEGGPCLSFTHNSVITSLANRILGSSEHEVELGEVVGPGGLIAVYEERGGYGIEVLFEPEIESPSES